MSEKTGDGSLPATREDIRRKRELEEARKSGLIPAERDDEGREINPHIPQFIAKAPWYVTKDSGPSLKHQRRSEGGADGDTNRLAEWYRRGLKEEDETAGTRKKFKKGACANCGATTHKEADCVERPRTKKAKYTNANIAPDEYIPSQDIKAFEAKRDRWGGYDPAAYQLVVENYEELEKDAQKRRNSDKKKERESEDETKIGEFDAQNAPIGTKDDRTRTTTRNLRIREDTAKYLINLDPSSAFYDPKTRSMREDPTQTLPQDLKEKILYRGDNAVRETGEALLPKQMEVFAWQSYTQGKSVNVQTNPTAVALQYKEGEEKRKVESERKRKDLMSKYGCSSNVYQQPI